MLTALLLSLVEESGTAVLTLMGTLGRSELIGSRLTRREVSRQVLSMSENLARLPEESRKQLASLDFEGWELSAKLIRLRGADGDDALWFAVSSLVPATLIWLRHYRKTEPDLFSWTPESLRNMDAHEP